MLFGCGRTGANGPAGLAAAGQTSQPWVGCAGSFPLGSAALAACAAPVFAQLALSRAGGTGSSR